MHGRDSDGRGAAGGAVAQRDLLEGGAARAPSRRFSTTASSTTALGYEPAPLTPELGLADYARRDDDDRIDLALRYAERAALLEEIGFLHGDQNPENLLFSTAARGLPRLHRIPVARGPQLALRAAVSVSSPPPTMPRLAPLRVSAAVPMPPALPIPVSRVPIPSPLSFAAFTPSLPASLGEADGGAER